MYHSAHFAFPCVDIILGCPSFATCRDALCHSSMATNSADYFINYQLTFVLLIKECIESVLFMKCLSFVLSATVAVDL